MKEKILICYVDVRNIDYKNVESYIKKISNMFSEVSEDIHYFLPIRGETEIKFLYNPEMYENEIEINKIKINNIIKNIQI